MEDKDLAMEMDMLNKLTHDLMNPMTVILGYSQLLASRDDLPQEAKQQAMDIYEQAMESANIVEQIKKLVNGRTRMLDLRVMLVTSNADLLEQFRQLSKMNFELIHTDDLDDLVNQVYAHNINVIVVDLGQIPMADLEKRFRNILSTGTFSLILIVSGQEEAENLRSMGYKAIVPPLRALDFMDAIMDKNS